MYKLYIFQARFVKVDELGWWSMEMIQTDAGTQFTSKEFLGGIYVGIILLELVALDHQEINVRHFLS